MDANFRFRDRVAILAALHASSQAAGIATTAWAPAANFHRMATLVDIGSVGVAGTVSVALLQAQDAAGTGSKAIVNLITGLPISTAVPLTVGNQQVELGLLLDNLDGNNGFAYVALQVTVGVNAVMTQGTLFGTVPRVAPANQYSNGVVYA